jgi:hypothetical protein
MLVQRNQLGIVAYGSAITPTRPGSRGSPGKMPGLTSLKASHGDIHRPPFSARAPGRTLAVCSSLYPLCPLRPLGFILRARALEGYINRGRMEAQC